MLANGRRDEAGIALLIIGVVLAVVASLLPAIQVTGRSGLVTMTTWQVVPFFTAAQLAVMGALVAAAFLPGLQKWRAALAVAAVAMVFVPALSTFLSGIYAWGTVRADLVRLSGERQPFVKFGSANAVLVVAACTIAYAAWRLEALGRPAVEAAEPAPAAVPANSEAPLAAAA